MPAPDVPVPGGRRLEAGADGRLKMRLSAGPVKGKLLSGKITAQYSGAEFEPDPNEITAHPRAQRAVSAEGQMSHGEDRQAGHRPHHGAVDPDELEVLAHLQFDFPGGFFGIPAGYGVGDNTGDI
ncbi:MAG: hypothetical protein K0Q84_2424 [Arthrobacter sp.]|nr:hypothetical protein [Arthrobacter sp.]